MNIILAPTFKEAVKLGCFIKSRSNYVSNCQSITVIFCMFTFPVLRTVTSMLYGTYISSCGIQACCHRKHVVT